MDEHMGERLYRAYAQFHLDQFNCHVEEWDDLDDNERAAWQHVAEVASDKGD